MSTLAFDYLVAITSTFVDKMNLEITQIKLIKQRLKIFCN